MILVGTMTGTQSLGRGRVAPCVVRGAKRRAARAMFRVESNLAMLSDTRIGLCQVPEVTGGQESHNQTRVDEG